MLTKTNKIICDACGKFVSIKDIAERKAKHFMVDPESDMTRERFESICKKCMREEMAT